MSKYLVALCAVVLVACDADDDTMPPGEAVKSVIAQAYVCGLREARGQPEPGCATAKRYVEEVGGEDAALERIRHWTTQQ